MRITDPDQLPRAGQTVPPQQPDTPSRSTSPTPRSHLSVIVSIVVVLVIAASVGTLLSRNSSLFGGRLTGTAPITPHIPPSVYMLTGGKMYAVTASNGTLRWQTPANGPIIPDPIVANGVIYTTLIPSGHVIARRASDGAVLWNKFIATSAGNRIALAGDTIYMTTDMLGSPMLTAGFVHGVYALRASDGAIRWHHDTTDPVISPPLVVDGVVYAGVGTSLIALRASDGTQLWQRPLAVGSHQYLAYWLSSSAGTIYTFGSEQNLAQPYGPVFGANNAAVFAVQSSDGAVRWSHQLDGGEDQGPEFVSAPVIGDGIIYVRSHDHDSPDLAKGVVGFTLHAVQASDGKLLWTYPSAFAQPVAAGGAVYAGDASGNIVALHGSDGAVIWKHLVGGPVRDFWRMSLAIANGTLYASVDVPDKNSQSSSTTLKALNASDGQQRWACPLPGSSTMHLGTPVFAA